MFPQSSQLKFWTFSGTTEVNKLRAEANQKYIQEYGKHIPVSSVISHNHDKINVPVSLFALIKPDSSSSCVSVK